MSWAARGEGFWHRLRPGNGCGDLLLQRVGGYITPSNLTKMVGADMSTVSRHLSILKGAGIIVDEKRGAQVYYGIRIGCVLNFFDCVESVMKCNARDQRKLLAN